jgi:CHAT domain-containing protein
MGVAPSPARARPAGEVVLVAGPALDGAEDEVRDLAGRYPEAHVLTGEEATADAVADALDGAGLAHVAAHGSFRADNPLFSVLHMADGPLTIHDLVPLDAPPTLLVLSACDAGLAEVRPGDELIGFAAALLGMGSRTIVASLAPVPDREARTLMAALHDRLIAGDPPSVALATATAAVSRGADPRTRAVATSFVCLGAD